MFDWLKRLSKAQAPVVQMRPQSVSTNPTLSERAIRNKERVKRLHAALAVATTAERRASLAAELNRRVTTGR